MKTLVSCLQNMHLERSVFLLFALRGYPRLTLLYLLVSLYRDCFLPFIHVSCPAVDLENINFYTYQASESLLRGPPGWKLSPVCVIFVTVEITELSIPNKMPATTPTLVCIAFKQKLVRIERISTVCVCQRNSRTNLTKANEKIVENWQRVSTISCEFFWCAAESGVCVSHTAVVFVAVVVVLVDRHHCPKYLSRSHRLQGG